MASAFLSSIQSKTTQVLGFVRRWATSLSSSSDPRSGVLKDLEKLERTLKRIETVLLDAEEREIRDAAVKLWLEELRQVAYDAEDVLDEYHYEELRAQVEGGASRKRKRVEGDDAEEVSGSLSTTVSIPDGMGDRIREIRERFDEISSDRERLRLREEDGERRVSGAAYPVPTSHMVDESTVYGREDGKNKIIDQLLSEGMGDGVFVIPIVGKGGLGKTTIAQLVYNDSKVKEYFELTGWVCVSDDFDVTRLTKDIIESITQNPCGLTQLSTLQNSLNKEVKGKRVLLVLDDVWNDQPSLWESLRAPFVGAETVRIIMTCRNDSVAEIMQTVRPHHPGCLSEEQSWSLFRNYAFGGGDSEEQSTLVDIGKQIVKKCSGLPLAVKTIGSLLRHMTDEDSWMDVLKSDLWEVDENNETLVVLRLSYSRMPAHLKPCFVYCSMFPQDYKFEKDRLVRLWMAQGYIVSRGERRLEDIGDEYFNDLQRRSFFDSCYDNWFKMHDMIHDLAKSIAGNEVRHLYLGAQGVKSLSSYNPKALRTLLTAPHIYGRATKLPLSLPTEGYLRTLEFDWESVDEEPGSISNMKHLRYLHIRSGSKNVSFPESVCLLYHLQTLIFDCQHLAELPDGLGNLINLRHLQIKTLPYLPAWIGKLTNLQTLHGKFLVRRGKKQGGIGVLKDLVNLQGSLCISNIRNLVNIEDAKDASLKSKHRLKGLYLVWDYLIHYLEDAKLLLIVHPEENEDILADEKMEEAMLKCFQPHANLKKLQIMGYSGFKFPKWVGDPSSLASLQQIAISQCKNASSLPLYIHDSIGKEPLLCTLERVYIFNCWQLTSINGLHHLRLLKELGLASCPKLQLVLEEELPPDLEKLTIRSCQQLTPLGGLQNLHLLKTLCILSCPQLQFVSVEGLPSKLEQLYIEKCQQLTSLSGLQNFHLLKTLYISSCSQLQLVSEEGLPSKLPSKLETLYIMNCQQLTSLGGLQNLHLLKRLHISSCPQFQLVSEEELPPNLEGVHISGTARS